jgi:hypothetical protein
LAGAAGFSVRFRSIVNLSMAFGPDALTARMRVARPLGKVKVKWPINLANHHNTNRSDDRLMESDLTKTGVWAAYRLY